LDVAATAEELWDRLPRNARALPSQALNDDETARSVCVFLAAAHDVGKANRYFQAKDRSQHERLRSLRLDLPPFGIDEVRRHGQATGAHLKPWLIDHWKWSCHSAECVALAVGGHHGTFFENTKQSTLGVGAEPWRSFGRDLLDALAEVQTGPLAPCEPEPLNPFLGWLSGFVSVADWLGSHETITTWATDEQPLADYMREARIRAQKLFEHLQWQTPPETPIQPVADLLPVGCNPNPLQLLASRCASAFSLAIVEAPTGEGKTEAAFALAEPRRSDGTGVYFALPTMATANGLHGRVEAYLRKAAGCEVETLLLHSQAWLFRESVQTVNNPGAEGTEQETQAQDWFAGSKRGLLAPYGVGTIDQALVAALRAKHGFVRLFALAGKTVVIDEVHAYDVYMSGIFEVLLGWLRALGCRVILLSATLPKARRRALLKAWGAKGDEVLSEYPSLTWVAEDGRACSSTFPVQARKPLAFELVMTDGTDPWAKGAEEVLRVVASCGGLGALILNTVRDAQQAFAWLCEQASSEYRIDLFHARFTAHDRDAIEKGVLSRFGRDHARDRPSVLVATQVVEQSLDLDFDHMVSALAPIDLLIQRAGRLHRHRRWADGRLRNDDGPDERSDPVLCILAPPCSGDGVPDIEDLYAHDVLMRTFQRLETNPQVHHPSDVSDAIEAVYGDADRTATVSAWEERLRDLEAKTTARTAQVQQQASRATIGAVDDEDCLIVETVLDLDDNDDRQGSQLAARTRLEDRPSITVALLEERDGRLATIHGRNPDNARDATFACVRVSPPYPLWEAMLAIEPLPAWHRKGALSRARPLVLTYGRTELAGYEICYDSRRGLDWRKVDADVST